MLRNTQAKINSTDAASIARTATTHLNVFWPAALLEYAQEAINSGADCQQPFTALWSIPAKAGVSARRAAHGARRMVETAAHLTDHAVPDLQAHSRVALRADKAALHIGAVAFIHRFGTSLNRRVYAAPTRAGTPCQALTGNWLVIKPYSQTGNSCTNVKPVTERGCTHGSMFLRTKCAGLGALECSKGLPIVIACSGGCFGQRLGHCGSRRKLGRGA